MAKGHSCALYHIMDFSSLLPSNNPAIRENHKDSIITIKGVAH